ncbi:DNA polymerase type B, organellar and viral-domain-containing protein [Lobosporangium transversale]|uniref:Probable DNA polymerase n=1 Tax=Lobosporangium transversale TaxID=64571 RepID=A0A1Y2FZA9_9FUNG|nr:DNA polymerase type B, organellar and viral-domain-containing protein [Lobosporangium transversale]ORY88692.1 DNA polymerase type B, organellar and viral-domain-containing protein [Lobosporangium transversale]|eukprot:XP_021875004.1 DNA polymerase type B, organellar and viral-domain-containing protein [Lobosporangium transversale]
MNKDTRFVIQEIDINTLNVKVYDKTDIKILEFTDENFGDYFIRNVNDLYIKIDHKENVLFIEKTFNTKFVKPTSRELVVKNKIITFDIEAFLHPINKEYFKYLNINENKSEKDLKMFIPFACGFYDGQASYKFYLSDFDNYKDMLKACIFEMAKPKYNDFTIYVHCGGKFDFIFIVDVIKEFNDVELIGKQKFTGKDSKIIGFDIKVFNPIYKDKSKKFKGVTLKFRDSYKLLAQPLRDLTEEFKVEKIKGIFPYMFPNSSNLNYIGEFPDYSTFNKEDISFDEYSILKNENPNSWNLKEECFKYLDSDLIGLHQVLMIFSKLIYEKYRLNITKLFSISSLAMKIFTSNYLKSDNIIPIINNRKVHKDIRNALYGGRVEVFNPIVSIKSYMYDINSIYPWAMIMPMPVGSPIFSTNTDLNQLFGIVYATVIVPEHADPILPFRTEDGQLIFPKGKWTAWFFSEELKNAQFYGVKVTVHHSYIFDKSNDLFKDFIEYLYEKKRTSKDSKRAIYKLIMNSSYGRWALKFFKTVIDVVDVKTAEHLLLTHNVEEYIKYKNDKVFVRYSALPDVEQCNDYNVDYGLELIKSVNSQHDSISSIPIGVAITSWARILMSSFLFNPSNPCSYTDTDCGIFAKKLPKSLITDKLGGWKLEHTIKKGLFPLDKVYSIDSIEKGLIRKNKGVNNKLSTTNFIDLYKGKSIDLTEKRWIKDLSCGLVYVDNMDIYINNIYSKRNKIFYKGYWIGTEPLTILDGKIIYKPVLSNFSYINYLFIIQHNLIRLYDSIDKSLVIYKNQDVSLVIYKKI